MSPPKATFCTLPLSTWSRNCEYDAPCAPAPEDFGEKLWKTTISTTATTTHSRRFLVKSFILIGSGVPLSAGVAWGRTCVHCELTSCGRVFPDPRHTPETLARGFRLADGDLVVPAAHVAHVVVEAFTLEQLDQNAPPVLRWLSAKSRASSARCIIRGWSTAPTPLLWGHVRQHKVYRLIPEHGFKLR